MLTALELQNFKGIGERRRVEIRLVTLTSGPNSASKTTLLQALLLNELITHGTATTPASALGPRKLGEIERDLALTPKLPVHRTRRIQSHDDVG